MTKRDIISLACKIVAFLILANMAIPTARWVWGSFFVPGNTLTSVSGILVLVGQLLVITACVLLWLKAERIAERFIPASTPESVLFIDANFAPSIIALAGVVIFILAISSLFVHFGLALTPSFLEPLFGMSLIYRLLHMSTYEISQIAADTLQIVTGIGLFFGANAISQKLQNRIHRIAAT